MTTRALAALFVLILSIPAYAQDTPGFDVSGSYSLFVAEKNRSVGIIDLPPTVHGWLASITGNVGPVLGITGEVGGYYKGSVDTSIYSFMVGPRFKSRRNTTAQPYAHVLVGGVRVSASDNGDTISDTELTLAFGGGVDLMFRRTAGIRVGADYMRFFEPDDGINMGRAHIGIVLTFGGR